MFKSIAKSAPTPLTMRILAIARYTLLEAWRNRFALLLIGVATIIVLLSMFVRQQTITEASRVQVAFLASTLRFASVFIVVVYVLQGSVREVHDKVVELMLSLDLPRSSYLAGKFLGYAVLGAACAGIVSLPLLLLTDPENVLRWTYSHMLELWIVTAFALFCI